MVSECRVKFRAKVKMRLFGFNHLLFEAVGCREIAGRKGRFINKICIQGLNEKVEYICTMAMSCLQAMESYYILKNY